MCFSCFAGKKRGRVFFFFFSCTCCQHRHRFKVGRGKVSGSGRDWAGVFNVCGVVFVRGLREGRVGPRLVQVDVGDVQTDVVLSLQAGQDAGDGQLQRSKAGPQLWIGVPALEDNAIPGETKRGQSLSLMEVTKWDISLLSYLCWELHVNSTRPYVQNNPPGRVTGSDANFTVQAKGGIANSLSILSVCIKITYYYFRFSFYISKILKFLDLITL